MLEYIYLDTKYKFSRMIEFEKEPLSTIGIWVVEKKTSSSCKLHNAFIRKDAYADI